MKSTREYAATERLRDLRTRTADRPAHARYLEALEGAAQPLLDDGKYAAALASTDDVPIPKGVSGRVAEAIQEDYDAILSWLDPANADKNMAQYPNAYSTRRGIDGRAAGERAYRAGQGGVAKLLPDTAGGC